jgi:hypothetical protein
VLERSLATGGAIRTDCGPPDDDCRCSPLLKADDCGRVFCIEPFPTPRLPPAVCDGASPNRRQPLLVLGEELPTVGAPPREKPFAPPEAPPTPVLPADSIPRCCWANDIRCAPPGCWWLKKFLLLKLPRGTFAAARSENRKLALVGEIGILPVTIPAAPTWEPE